jgi:hypothetical protein
VVVIQADAPVAAMGALLSFFVKADKAPPAQKSPPPKPSTVDTKDRAILDLKRARDKLERYRKQVRAALRGGCWRAACLGSCGERSW